MTREQLAEWLSTTLAPLLDAPLTIGVDTHGPMTVGADVFLLEEVGIVKHRPNDPGMRVWRSVTVGRLAEALEAAGAEEGDLTYAGLMELVPWAQPVWDQALAAELIPAGGS